MAHDKGAFVDDDRVHKGHIGTIIEIIAVIIEGKLIRNGRAIIKGVPVHIVEELDYMYTGEDQVLEGAGLVQVVNFLAGDC